MDPPVTLVDDYYWLRDDTRSSEEVLQLLHSENAYTESRTAHLAPLRATLYDEMLTHLQEGLDEHPSPAADGYEYWSRTVKGLPFRQHVRRPCSSGAGDLELVLDVNAVAASLPAEQQAHCAVSEVVPSPSGRLLAYTVDGSGYENYEVRVTSLVGGAGSDGGGGAVLEVLEGTAGSVAWLGEAHLFYATRDGAHRPWRVWRHALGTPQARDLPLISADLG